MILSELVVLITGATSGVGRSLANNLAKRGAKVVATGRRPDALDELRRMCADIITFPCDVTELSSIKRLACQIEDTVGPISMLVNSAGIAGFEDWSTSIDLELSNRIIQTNLSAVISMTATFLPQLKQHDRSTIINMSSVLGFVPLTSLPTYCATKAAIHSFSLSLRDQLKPFGIGVVEIIAPGLRTSMLPGLLDDDRMVAVEDFVDAVLGRLAENSDYEEICVDPAPMLRNAEREGRFADIFALVNRPTNAYSLRG